MRHRIPVLASVIAAVTTAMVVAIVLTFALGGNCARAAASSSCPVTGAGPYSRCIDMPASATPRVGQEITAGNGSNPGTPWMVTDSHGAPMAWVNLYGLYSGGDGGKMPGGLICVTDGTAATVACLTPEGTLQLGEGSNRVTLTPADIRFLHRLKAGQTAACWRRP